jgi:protein-disulfide isomerase
VLVVSALACADAQSAPGSAQATPPSQDTVVADVGGRQITLKEVDERWQAMDPGERARVTQLLYQNRRNMLDLIVGDALIEQAAEAAGLATAQYVDRETTNRLKLVTDADVQQYFEANKDRAQGRTLEQLQTPIRNFLTSQRQQQARAQLVDDLRKASPARVMLDPPRQTVKLADHDPYVGPVTAPVTIVEFSDYQ